MTSNLDHKKKGSKLNWLIGIFISFLAAGGGIAALLEYKDSSGKDRDADFNQRVNAWNNFSPESLELGVQYKELLANAPFDLEKGAMTTGKVNRTSDLVFECWPQAKESLKALKGLSWSDQGAMNFEKITYRKIRDAKYSSPKHPKNGRFLLFLDHKSNVPGKNHVFFVKTAAGNIAKVQIVGYKSDPNPQVCRSMKIKYEVFPIVRDPPKPKR
jgi:hypothetical protein